MLGGRVDEVAGTRSHQYEHGNLQSGEKITKQLHVRRGAATREIRAQLEAMRTTLDCCERRVQRLDGRLDDNIHGSAPDRLVASPPDPLSPVGRGGTKGMCRSEEGR